MCDVFSTEWHQYDGIMMKEPDKDLLNFLKTPFLKLTGHHRESIMTQIKMAVLAMLPDWNELANEQDDMRAEKLLDNVDQVCYCVEMRFQNEDFKTDTGAVAEVSSTCWVKSIYSCCMPTLLFSIFYVTPAFHIR